MIPPAGRGLAPLGGAVAFVLAAACAETTQPRWIDEVRPSVDSLYLLPGGTARVEAQVFDQRGDAMPGEWIPRVAWTVTDSSVVELDVDDTGVTLKGLAPGFARLRVQLGRGDRQVPIYVLPPGLDSIAVDPPVLVLGRATERGVTALLFDAEGAELSPEGHRISWVIEDTSIAVLPSGPEGSSGAAVRARNRVGETRIRLIVENRTAWGRIVVNAAPPSLENVRVRALSETSLEVIWEQETRASDGYRVYRAPARDGPYLHIASPGIDRFFGYIDTTWVDTGLQPATSYWYRVEACNEEACSLPSDATEGTTAAAAGVDAAVSRPGASPPRSRSSAGTTPSSATSPRRPAGGRRGNGPRRGRGRAGSARRGP